MYLLSCPDSDVAYNRLVELRGGNMHGLQNDFRFLILIINKSARAAKQRKIRVRFGPAPELRTFTLCV
jgi:hypothetical protein